MRTAVVVLSLLSLAGPLAAQGVRPGRGAAPATATPEAVRRAIETITEADVRQRIGLLAHDSMRGRDTPSPELEQTANWIASEFRRFGLRPGGENGTFFQRYTIRRFTLDSTSTLTFSGRGAPQRLALGIDVALLTGAGPASGRVGGPVVLLSGGPVSPERPFGDVSVRDAIVLFIPGAAQVNVGALVQAADQQGARGWITAQAIAAANFSGGARRSWREQQEIVGGDAGLPVLVIRDSTALPLLQAAGLDLATLRTSPSISRALSGVTAQVEIRRNVMREATAPNVIGILEGSDPVLRNEYIFYTAHMDHVGVGRAVNGDSIYNGADDDASGTAGVVELAEAFSQLTPRPRRSLVFMTVSGEEHGLWGSEYYSENPLLPIASTVANLNLDMIGRNWRDTISVIGKEHSTLGQVAERVSRANPELNMALVDDLWPNENFYFRSDHFNFARKGVPILFFFNGVHADYHRPSDTVDKIDAEKEMRILRMLFHIGMEVANTTERPQWNPESYRRIVEQNPTP